MNKHWLRKWLRGEPHIIIGGEENPYLLRWYVIPRNRFFNIYLHKFLRSDDDRALHDHPWWFLSLILKGAYYEHRPDGVIHRKAGSFALRRPNMAHRVELERRYATGALSGTPMDWAVWNPFSEIPTWTLFFTGPKLREWGFYCPGGWVHWNKFVDQNGCGEYA